jgi:uncharacterized protein (TIGR02598 family)
MFLRACSPAFRRRYASPSGDVGTGRLDRAMKAQITKIQRKGCAGFNLVEIAMALAIVSFSCTCLLGLLPASLTAFHQAMGNTIESQIVQSISNDLELEAFSSLTSTTYTTTATYYYDGEGQALPSSAGVYYTATVNSAKVTSTISPVDLSGTPGSPAAYNVTVKISYAGLAQPHVYCFIIANSGLNGS